MAKTQRPSAAKTKEGAPTRAKKAEVGLMEDVTLKPSDHPDHDAPAYTPEESAENRAPPPENAQRTLSQLADNGLVLVGPDAAEIEAWEPSPGVGDLVHFWSNDDAGPYAAIVTQANADASTHLAVFRAGSMVVTAELDVPHEKNRAGNGRFWRSHWEN